MIHGTPNRRPAEGSRTTQGVPSAGPDASREGDHSHEGDPSATARSADQEGTGTGDPFPPLTAEELGPDPLAAFTGWFEAARLYSNARYPDAMTLSTIDEQGWPAGRIVLLKGVDARGFSFFTNYRSAKGRALEGAGRAALTFYWGDLLRQVRAVGTVARLSEAESDEYFHSRPLGSRIGAWASLQSESLESRELLEARAREVEARYPTGDVPRPPHWGGYLLTPNEIEFWQEGASRLHDRFRYRRTSEGGWAVERLNP